MRQLFKILVILLILSTLCAPSCVDEEEISNREESMLSAARNEIRAEFEKDYLTQASLFAHEAAAIQELYDFADYLQIVADTSLDSSFRFAAIPLILNSFVNDKVTVHLFQSPCLPDKEATVDELLKRASENALEFHPFSFDSIYVSEPLHRTGASVYSGTLYFIQKFTFVNNSQNTKSTRPGKANFFVVRENKIFGSDTINAWTVRLGKIR